MTKITVHNQTGAEVGTLELSDVVFGTKPKKDVVHQVWLAQEANRREPWADSKDRGEVRGGGKKPWKQKGTGRARHGSIRSPIWKGGGVTFGPLSVRNYVQKINKTMKRVATRMCLTDKATEQKLIVLDTLTTEGKTKNLSATRLSLPGSGRTTVFVTAGKDDSLLLAAKNLPKTAVVRAEDVTVSDLLKSQYVIATKAAVEILEQRLK